MKRDPNRCLSEEEFVLFVEDDTPEERADQIQTHLTRCGSCFEQVATFLEWEAPASTARPPDLTEPLGGITGLESVTLPPWGKDSMDAKEPTRQVPVGDLYLTLEYFERPDGLFLVGLYQVLPMPRVWKIGLYEALPMPREAAVLANKRFELWQRDSEKPWKIATFSEVIRGVMGAVARIPKEERIGRSAPQELGIVVPFRTGFLLVDGAFEPWPGWKDACEQFFDQFDFSTSKIGVMQLDGFDRVSTLCPLCPDQERLVRSLDKVRPDPSTSWGNAIRLATKRLPGDQTDRFLVILAQHEPDDRELTAAAIREANEAGIDVYCVGLPGADRTILAQLVSDPQKLSLVSDFSEMSEALKKIAATVSSH